MRYRSKFLIIWAVAIVFSIFFYFISTPGYQSDAQILMKNTRKPWSGFKQGALPRRYAPQDDENMQILTLRDPFWNFLYDQTEKTTYDLTPFFYARTTVFKIINELGCREHFDDGSMGDDEIVLAFTENLEVDFNRVEGIYHISYTFVDPLIARAIVDKYTGLFSDFINEMSLVKNVSPTEAVKSRIEKLETEIDSIENQMAELKSSTGIIAPTEFLAMYTSHIYVVEMKLVQAQSRAKASFELLNQSEQRIVDMTAYGSGKIDFMTQPVREVLVDPILTIILARIFWDSLNLTQAQVIYQDNTPQIEYWQERLEASRRLLMRRMSEDEKARAADLLAAFTEESAKTLWLTQYKSDLQSQLNKLPAIEKEYIYLQRQRVSKRAMLKNFRDLQDVGEGYIQKGDKISTVLDSAYFPHKKSEPNFMKILVTILFASTISGFGWFFIRENLEVHSHSMD